MHWQGLNIPEQVKWDEETLTSTYGRCTYAPLERGLARLIGNSLRRVLLSSLKGAAVTTVRIEGVLHEFSTIPGVWEDVAEIILHIKKLAIKMETESPRKMTLHVVNPLDEMREITAGDIQTDPDVEILESDAHLAYLDRHGRLDMEMEVEVGRGYAIAEMTKVRSRQSVCCRLIRILTPFAMCRLTFFRSNLISRIPCGNFSWKSQRNGSITPPDALGMPRRCLKTISSVYQFP
jgi:DNA-directed RNA polymerase subunit alpha